MLNEWKLAIYPIIPMHMFSKRHNIACLLVCFFHGFVFIGGSYYLPLYFQACLGDSPIRSGVLTLATALPLSFLSVLTGVFIRKTGQYLPPVWFGFVFLTLGYGLFTDLRANSSMTKIILYQIIAGIGVGPNFQAPLIALQSNINPRDIGSATATFQFIRNIATSTSVVIGGVVFQNEMQKQAGKLIAELGQSTAQELSGFSAGASTQLIDKLPPGPRTIARDAFAQAMHYLWIMYVCFAAAGLLCCAMIRRKKLEKKHEQTKTGLEAEKEKRAERLRLEDEKRKAKQAGGRGPNVNPTTIPDIGKDATSEGQLQDDKETIDTV